VITVLHGGQTGADRGAHEAAVECGWLVAGYKPHNSRDERGPIPEAVARCLWPCDKPGFGARTEANVRCCDALLVVVPRGENPRATPGTAKTIELAEKFHKRRMIVDPGFPAGPIAAWIWRDLLALRTLPLPLDTRSLDPVPARLMVAGPRESKWSGAELATVEILRKVAVELRALNGDRRST
jgi:hypothetical protein